MTSTVSVMNLITWTCLCVLFPVAVRVHKTIKTQKYSAITCLINKRNLSTYFDAIFMLGSLPKLPLYKQTSGVVDRSVYCSSEFNLLDELCFPRVVC